MEQWVVEPAFAGAVNGEPGSPTGTRDLTELAVSLVRMAKRESRRIVSWSLHDYKLLTSALGGRRRTPNALRYRYRNAIVTAERWAKAAGVMDDVGGANRQAAYMRLVEFHVPEAAGAGLTGDSLHDIRKMLATRENDWAGLTPKKREKFAAVLEHNWYDLHGMRAVMQRAAGELDVRQPHR